MYFTNLNLTCKQLLGTLNKEICSRRLSTQRPSSWSKFPSTIISVKPPVCTKRSDLMCNVQFHVAESTVAIFWEAEPENRNSKSLIARRNCHWQN